MDINTILTVLAAPDDCKELIRALAVQVHRRDVAIERLRMELESTQMALESMTNAHDLLLEDLNPCVIESLRVERDTALERLAALESAVKRQAEKPALPEPGSSLDDLLRYAAASETEVCVTLAGPWKTIHDGKLEGVPKWSPDVYGMHMPWSVDSWHCGATASNDPDERIIAVELL